MWDSSDLVQWFLNLDVFTKTCYSGRPHSLWISMLPFWLMDASWEDTWKASELNLSGCTYPLCWQSKEAIAEMMNTHKITCSAIFSFCTPFLNVRFYLSIWRQMIALDLFSSLECCGRHLMRDINWQLSKLPLHASSQMLLYVKHHCMSGDKHHLISAIRCCRILSAITCLLSGAKQPLHVSHWMLSDVKASRCPQMSNTDIKTDKEYWMNIQAVK